jgi:hypothetical protein
MLIILSAVNLLLFQAVLQASDGDKDTNFDPSVSTKETVSEQNANYSYINSEAQEEEMKIENWMLDPYDTFWQEKEIKLESWMFDIYKNYCTPMLSEEREEYPIESWMMNPSDWNISTDEVAENYR